MISLRAQRGFTLVELLFVIVIMVLLATLAYPHINSALDEAGFIECQSRLEMLRRAKTAYVLDHLGESTNAEGDGAVFRSYFPQRFSFRCPRDQATLYSNPYGLYSISTCPYCLAHPTD